MRFFQHVLDEMNFERAAQRQAGLSERSYWWGLQVTFWAIIAFY